MTTIGFKKIILVLISTAFLLSACDKNITKGEERLNLPPVEPMSMKNVTELIWVPVGILPQTDPLGETGIGMMIYSRLFLLNTKQTNGTLYLEAIKQGIKHNRLLKFFVENGTGRIYAVQYVTEVELEKFKNVSSEDDWRKKVIR